ncbi:Inositol-1-monophosphatase [Thalassovita gelatinovora]|uniref:Inositol-1-monophosphatase n=1 Tax=Thalassovita gelatinovora TaxID=53501 RepID=A0A0P1F767_THAGE|nr:3'(2'),5'-bisphosphate nucleotidase CysQ [Thalassovita gelatinovora]QIZ80923.1 3'(2'),5'-bisphosphate nucleotidase CysQ [Thalassovita gelatinovora]CUH63423.1 Inositol-1-monophosphatase [Thalassovita gelatinovora]SEQ66762.1 myo-inositol-1(or 4)-monophosphatase [Thalassovita gelatinovora]
MPATDLDLLIEAAREAGDIARSFSGPTAQAWNKPGDQGPVTEADLAVNSALHARLIGARPSYGWLSEEDEDTAHRLTRPRVFIIDPLDGTRSFIEGASTWAHSLAIADNGVVTAAAIYLPMKDKLYTAAAGQGAFLNGQPIRVSTRQDLTGASVLAAKPNYTPTNWKGQQVPDVKRSYRPSLAYRLSLVAEGRYDAMMTLRDSWEWDIAAGDLILREAGATVSDVRGAALRFNNPHPKVKGVIAAGSAVHDAISRRLAHWP